MTTIGTPYFVSRATAVAYYADYERAGRNRFEQARQNVERKIAAGEIHIGKPPTKYPTDRIITIDNGRRYAIKTLTEATMVKRKVKLKPGATMPGTIEVSEKFYTEFVKCHIAMLAALRMDLQFLERHCADGALTEITRAAIKCAEQLPEPH